MSTSAVRVPPQGAKWPADVETVFVDLMYSEVLKGNIYTTTFTPAVWKDIMNNLTLQCGIAYDVKRLKAKRSRMKKLCRKFHELMVAETGLGWDDKRNMPIASAQLWKEIVQRNPIFAELRHKECPHYYKLCAIFSGWTATGYAARASTQMSFAAPPPYTRSAPTGDENQADAAGLEPSPMQTQSSCPSLSQTRRRDIADVIVQLLEKIVDQSSTSHALQHEMVNYTASRVMEVLREIPNITQAQLLEAVAFLEDKARCKFFMAMTPEERIGYLQTRLNW